MPLPLIAVDIGNTSIRIGLFETVRKDPLEPANVLLLDCALPDSEILHEWLPDTPVRWYVCSVHRGSARSLRKWVARWRLDDTYDELSHAHVPIVVDVDAPQLVGMDRLMAAVAADHVRQPDRPVIAIDAGSAITVDALSANGAFLGGSILPGISMSAAALDRDTDQLPQVNPLGSWAPETATGGKTSPQVPPGQPDVIGKSTQDAIRSGLIWGTVGALKELTGRMAGELSGNPHMLFTGGDAIKLAYHVSESAELVPNLVLNGIALVARRDDK